MELPAAHPNLDADDAGRIFSGESPGDQAGRVVRACEVDGDGATDLLVAAPMPEGRASMPAASTS